MVKIKKFDKDYNKRLYFINKVYLNRQVHNSFLKDYNLSIAERQIIFLKKMRVRYNSSIVRFKNYCMLTGHSRSVYRDVKLCRHKFNQMALNGQLPGFFLSSW